MSGLTLFAGEVLESPVAPGHWLEPYVKADGSIDVTAAMHANWDIPNPEQDNLAVVQALCLGPDYLPASSPLRRAALDALGLATLSRHAPFLIPPKPVKEQGAVGKAIVGPWEAGMDWEQARRWAHDQAPAVDRYLSLSADRYAIPFVNGATYAQPVPDLLRVRTLGEALVLRMREVLQAGDVAGAVRIAVRLRKDGCLMTRGKSLIETMMGVALLRLASDAMQEVVRRPTVADADLAAWLQDRPVLVPLDRVMDRSERLWFIEIEPRELIHEISPVQAAILPTQIDMRAYRRCINDTWDDLMAIYRTTDLMEMERKNEAFGQRLHEWKGEAAIHGELADIGRVLRILRSPRDLGIYHAHLVQGIAVPNLLESRITMLDIDARLRLLDLACAIHRYRNAQSRWPAALGALPPEMVVADPFTGNPLRYQMAGDAWQVWSVGRNRTDNGGDARLDVVVGHEPPPAPPGADRF